MVPRPGTLIPPLLLYPALIYHFVKMWSFIYLLDWKSIFATLYSYVMYLGICIFRALQVIH